MEVNCRHCDRYLFTAKGTTIIEQLPCPNSKCRAKMNIKIVNSNSTMAEINYKFETTEQEPKETSHV